MQGITPVVAVILLLLVTISIVGFAFMFFSGVAQTAATGGEEQLKQQALQSGGLPRIEAVDKNKVYVRNVGVTALVNPTFYVAGRKIDATGPASLEPNNFGTYEMNKVQLADLPQVAEVKVTGGGFSDSIVAVLREIAAKIISMGTVLTTGMLVAGDPAISFHDSVGNDIAIILDNGNVGIGTTGPDNKLHIVGSNPILQIDHNTGNAGTVGIWLTHVNGADEQRKVAVLSEAVGSWGRGNLHLAVDTAADAGDVTVSDAKLTISGTTGNVGIGTASPGTLLEASAGTPTLTITETTHASQANLAFRSDVPGRTAGDMWQIQAVITDGGGSASG